MQTTLKSVMAIFVLSLMLGSTAYGQGQKATLIVKSVTKKELPSLAERLYNGTFVEAPNVLKEYNPKKRGINNAVPGKGLPKGLDPLWEHQLQKQTVKGTEPLLVFDAASANATPTDPTGAVGPNHFVNAWNSSFRIWDKEGNALTSPASLSNIFPGEDMGDPIVIYDQFADRFLVTQFYENGFLVAITQGPDPVNDGWYTYQFPTNTFPDYPKYSIWSDGYYITTNKDAYSAGSSEVVFVIDRDKIINGDDDAEMVGFPLPSIHTNGFYSPLGFNVTGTQMPEPGNAPIVYMQDDSWGGVSYDHLKIWNINVDWDTPSNSEISQPQEIDTEPFNGTFNGGSFSNLPQPSGPDIDALQATIMYMAQYRKFAQHNSVVFNFAVNLDGSGDLSGIRWYELRQDNDSDPWEIFQEGTYSQPEGHSAFSGNMAMDAAGNIALAYTVVSENINPSLRYTGRYASDEPGTMTIAEESIGEGTQSNYSSRYGDYSQMTIDPNDDLTFWSIGEYFTGGSRKNRVGVFKLANEFENDMGVVDITSPTEPFVAGDVEIGVTVRNFGTNDQTSIAVNYQVDQGEIVEELIDEAVVSGNDVEFIFETLVNLPEEGEEYTLKVWTSLEGDENPGNDVLTIQVTPALSNDVGVLQIVSPESGSNLTDNETISVVVKNYGVESQQNFNISYKLDDQDQVVEQFAGSIAMGEEIAFDFDQKADFSALMDYNLVVSTMLENDGNVENDAVEVTITNSVCQPSSDCSQGDGIILFKIGDEAHLSPCSPDGYGDFSNFKFNAQTAKTSRFEFATGTPDVYLCVWIDYNDNFVFENDEIVVDNFLLDGELQGGRVTGVQTVVIPDGVQLGEHLMRVRSSGGTLVPDDACEDVELGETQDYTVVLTSGVGVDDAQFVENELKLMTHGDNSFSIEMCADNQKQPMTFSLHDVTGRTVIYDRVLNVNGVYTYSFDMSYASPGVYLVRFGNDKFGKVKRIVVE